MGTNRINIADLLNKGTDLNLKRSNRHVILWVVLIFSISLLLSANIFAAQAFGFMWYHDNVTSLCLDDNNDGKELQETYAWESVEDWESKMDDYWSTTGLDYYVYASEIADNNVAPSWGDDDAYGNLDGGDATFFTTHGVNKSSYLKLMLTSDSGNDGGTVCATRSTEMRMGDADAEFVHIGACHSGDWDLVTSSAIKNAMADSLHQYGGFHGDWWTNGNEAGGDFAEEGLTTTGGLSIAWIENMTEWNIHGSDDNCAINLVQGTSQSDALYRKNYEDYNPTQFNDPDGEWIKYHFYCNCDPSSGSPLVCN